MLLRPCLTTVVDIGTEIAGTLIGVRTLWPAARARVVASGLLLALACSPGEVIEGSTTPFELSVVAEQGSPALNGCTENDYVVSSDSLTVIRFGHEWGHNYSPACLRVAAGTRIRFEGQFLSHPIEPGRIVDSIPIDVEGPVQGVEAGDSAEFVATTPGKFGYFCDLHVAEGMMGAIEVLGSSVALVGR